MHINEDDHEFYQILEWYCSMPIKESQILIGPLFNESMKVVTVHKQGNDVVTLGLGVQVKIEKL